MRQFYITYSIAQTVPAQLKLSWSHYLLLMRVNQNFFRQLVLANYKSKCAITGIDIPELLLASHIIPWSKNEKDRLNPENGICLSALYDKAFDKGLIVINERHDIIISNELKRHQNKEYFKVHFSPIENSKIQTPERFLPNKTFLEYHMDEIFALRNS